MKIDWLGDPHLGRSFVRGVPLHRRGERELMVWKQFTDHVHDTTADLHVNVGDIFDTAFVSYSTVLRAARAYQSAAELHDDTEFVILRGNHDGSRDLDKDCAFDAFEAILRDVPNVHVLREPAIIKGIGFVPWDPMKPPANLVQEVKGVDTVVGHWDLSGDGHNLIPVKALAELGVTTVYTGHEHRPRVIEMGGLEVNVVGSMQPYAFGEEVDETLYVTRSLDEVRADPDAYQNRVLRVDLKPGEIFDIEVDCLQLRVRRPEEVAADEEVVSFDTFDLKSLFQQAFDEEDVPAEIRGLVLERYEERQIAE